jgi:hypothetical protein
MKTLVCMLVATMTLASVACASANKGDCTPDAEESCKCPDGTQSIEQCQSNGTWGACQCRGQ